MKNGKNSIFNIFFIFLLAGSAPLFADLQDFKDKVEKEETENTASKKSSTNHKSERNKKRDGSLADDAVACGLGIAKSSTSGCGFFDVFGDHLVRIHFMKYPFEDGYMDSYLFVRRDKKDDPCDPDDLLCTPDSLNKEHETEDPVIEKTPVPEEQAQAALKKREESTRKVYYFNPRLNYMYLYDFGHAADVSVTGVFYKLFGPEISLFNITDGRRYVFHSRYGIAFYFANFSHIIVSLYGQYAMMRGFYSFDGGNMGIKFRIFVVKPVSLTLKIGGEFGNDSCVDGDVAVHTHIKWMDIQAGFRVYECGKYNLNAPYLGVGFWF